ncbi:potassium channel subfamily K member 16-like isoform X5 [Notothenia coriiceps]|uniref:Potassium channel subfamily K member 16-like isoform X5 n=1 Tax=Notothenia coriiceps TaxID=8208 RepID=A0A6I9NYB2_9TELE|nr:PREDICTED: potassium channel subfamily K member 16-like isoform X5 [Notothenia coriiceps]
MARFQYVRFKVSWTAILTLAHFTYLLVGATIFQILEREAESNNRNHFQLEKLHFLANYTCLDGPALEKFVQVILDAWEKGVNPSGNSTNPSNWDFSSSFFFAGTVVTTIGYGNLSPSTVSGQVFCVFYALCGIPLNLAFLKQLGKCLTIHLGRLERGMVSVVPHKPAVFSHPSSAVQLRGRLVVWRGLLFHLHYPQHHWFWRLCGTDPGKDYISLYRSLAGIWIIFALAWLALILNMGARTMEYAIGLTHPGFKKQKEEENVSSSTIEDTSNM